MRAASSSGAQKPNPARIFRIDRGAVGWVELFARPNVPPRSVGSRKLDPTYVLGSPRSPEDRLSPGQRTGRGIGRGGFQTRPASAETAPEKFSGASADRRIAKWFRV